MSFFRSIAVNKFKFLASKVMEIALNVMIHQVTLLICSVSIVLLLLGISGAHNAASLPPMLSLPGALACMTAIVGLCLTVLSGVVYAAALFVRAVSKI